MPKKDGRVNNHGKIGNAGGRPPGTPNLNQFSFRDLCRLRHPRMLARLEALSRQNQDLNVAFNATALVLYFGYGKPREHVTVEQQDTVLRARYPTVAEITADLIAHGLPIDHMKLPKLIEHK